VWGCKAKALAGILQEPGGGEDGFTWSQAPSNQFLTRATRQEGFEPSWDLGRELRNTGVRSPPLSAYARRMVCHMQTVWSP
jgi:hypothetical protein